jgi:two-component system NtrC family sensor kinase
MRVSHAAIYLYDTESEQFIRKSSRNIKSEGAFTIGRESALIYRLEGQKKPLVHEEIKRHAQDRRHPDTNVNEIEKALQSLRASVVVPSLLKDRLLGFIVLGDKRSGRTYTSEDLNTLSILASQFALAVENALLYGNLEEQVSQRTKELIDTQKQLVQAEKLATIGTLAGGVAHEINNPLAVILTNVQMLLAGHSHNAGLDKESLEMIEEATKRCRTIVQKLMVFAKKPMEATSVAEVDLLKVVKDIVDFLKYQLEQENITISVHAPQEHYIVMGNQNELEQVVGNIIINARDAIKQIKKSGSIDVTLAKGDGKIKVAIKDEGAGIPKEIVPRIFDPFFTTKDVGKGLGLGLSICQAIIEKHKGQIAVQSEPGKGSTFTIQFPRAKVEAKI